MRVFLLREEGLLPNCSTFMLFSFFCKISVCKNTCLEYFMASSSSFDLVQFQCAFKTAVYRSPSISAKSLRWYLVHLSRSLCQRNSHKWTVCEVVLSIPGHRESLETEVVHASWQRLWAAFFYCAGRDVHLSSSDLSTGCISISVVHNSFMEVAWYL